MGRREVEVAVREAARAAGVPAGTVFGAGKRRGVALARALACKLLVEKRGMPGVEVARHLGVTPAAVCRCITRARPGGGQWRSRQRRGMGRG